MPAETVHIRAGRKARAGGHGMQIVTGLGKVTGADVFMDGVPPLPGDLLPLGFDPTAVALDLHYGTICAPDSSIGGWQRVPGLERQ